jgi:CRP/FNR family cyclic AMP-dependent transcriptional regulator
VDPSPDLVELEEKILLQDPSLDPIEADDVEEAQSTGGEQVTFSRGELIIQEGAPSDTVYWIEDGKIEIFRAGPDGEISLAELGSGRYFGELAGLLGIRRTASARAITPVHLSTHTVEGFRRRLAEGG